MAVKREKYILKSIFVCYIVAEMQPSEASVPWFWNFIAAAKNLLRKSQSNYYAIVQVLQSTFLKFKAGPGGNKNPDRATFAFSLSESWIAFLQLQD